MKRCLSGLLCACLLLLCACKLEEKPITVLDLLGKPFQCDMTVTVAEAEFVGTFEKASGKSMTFALSEPTMLSGLLFTYDNGNVGLTLGRVSVSLDTEGLPSSAVTNVLFDLYKEESTGNEISLTEDLVVLRHTGSLDVTVVEFDRSTLVPLRCYTEKSGVEIQYTNYQLLEEDTP